MHILSIHQCTQCIIFVINMILDDLFNALPYFKIILLTNTPLCIGNSYILKITNVAVSGQCYDILLTRCK